MEECKDEGPENLILTLEYEREWLYIWIQVVDFEMGICSVHCKRFIREPGERTTLEEFLDEMDARFYKRQDVRAIIVAGEASVSGSFNLAKLARGVVGIDMARIMTEIPNSEVVSRGATAWARRTAAHPRRFIVQQGNYPSAHERDEHDEL
ncbi:hypothetical protein HBI56_054280 [Parastagonospora nodorum]|nr:hypothetical protein HBH56_097840 [Parastagonospora nodorum]KAH3930205.1 hypothetical protein HBH54_112160 [Parastagonospora nodorum]KAH3944989.1 hypothetical protein HBH53_147280 [Parastagonospora nodorum]KAH3966840.1 hypothetical protein HBH51_138680 [Parastagonospora nodorum]KAH3981166.1 hypothetical protein HBH52_085630 [Parastagonospora nodorum]